MSFVERNKAWLLPVLGAGVLAVLWMNYRMFRGPAPAPVAPQSDRTPPVQPPPVKPPSAPPAPAGPAGEDALWADLRRVEDPVPSFSRPELLLQHGQEPLSAADMKDTPAAALHPEAWTAIPEPRFPRKTAGEGAVPVPHGGPRPLVEFVLEQEGSRWVWFSGRAYRAGEKVQGTDYTVNRIGTDFVELTGPQGAVVESTNPLLDPGEKASHPSEAP